MTEKPTGLLWILIFMRLQEETRLTTRPTGDGSRALHISSPTTEMCSDPTQGNQGSLNQGLHFSFRLFT